MDDKVVGVIGGMGPEATVDLMRRVIQATPAEDDIDHIRMLVDNNPKVPSRIKALMEGTGESPGPCLAEMARNLVGWGAEFLAIPCNTAHYYYEEIRSAVRVPVLNMIHMTVEAVLRENPEIGIVGLLAADAVLKTALYRNRFREGGVRLIDPAPEVQARLMSSIRRIKTGRYGEDVRDDLRSAAEDLVGRGAEALIVGCTELSVVADALDRSLRVYDSSQVLAEGIVVEAKGGGNP